MKRDAIQLRKSPTFTRKITKVADFEKKIDKNSEKTVTKSAEKRKIQVSSPVEIKKKVKKTNIIKTITNEPVKCLFQTGSSFKSRKLSSTACRRIPG